MRAGGWSRRVLTVGLVLATPSLARADDEIAAAAHFAEGQKAFAGHDYARAATEFELANKAKPAAAAMLAAGVAWEFAGDLLNASTDLAAALADGGLETNEQSTARSHLASINTKVGHIAVVGPAGTRARIDDHQAMTVPVNVRALPGAHRVELVLPDGSILHETTDVVAGQTSSVAPPVVVAAPPITPGKSHGATRLVIGWSTMGMGASLFIAGAIAGGVGLSTRDQFVSGGDMSTPLHDEAVNLRTAANVLWVSAGLLAVTGFIIVITAPRAPSATVGLGPGSFVVRAIF